MIVSGCSTSIFTACFQRFDTLAKSSKKAEGELDALLANETNRSVVLFHYQVYLSLSSGSLISTSMFLGRIAVRVRVGTAFKVLSWLIPSSFEISMSQVIYY